MDGCIAGHRPQRVCVGGYLYKKAEGAASGKTCLVSRSWVAAPISSLSNRA